MAITAIVFSALFTILLPSDPVRANTVPRIESRSGTFCLQLDQHPTEGRNVLSPDLLHPWMQKMQHLATQGAKTFAVALFFLAPLCAQAIAQEALGSVSETSLTLRTILASQSEDSSSTGYNEIAEFYRARDFQPVWTGDDMAANRALRVLETLDRASEQGLRPEDYPTDRNGLDGPVDGAEAALYEIALTNALFRYASDVHSGRFKPKDVYKDALLETPAFDVAAQLNRALSHRTIDAFLEGLSPAQKQYRLLVAALARYRAIADRGGWPALSAKSRDRLAERLALEDPELAAVATPSAEEVHAAILRYERRNGMEDDGKLSPAMLAALNVPASERIQQIEANLERLRWMPQRLEHRYIAVNVPDQSVDFVRDGKAVLHSKVVVGKPDTPTPILRAQVRAIVANPPWDLSDPIAAELLPHLRKDPNYLLTKNIVLADGPVDDPYGQNIDWSKVTANTIPYQLRQRPGGGNALGTLMLDMPNDFDVYLHDTPNKDLFKLETREKSHGCVRVEEIYPLASLILTDDAENGVRKLTDAVATGETIRLPVEDPIPVYLLYWTAIPQADGTVGFRTDRYGRDAKLIALLRSPPAKKSPPSEFVRLSTVD
jgi:murein L,D-transpeptidase YcbB/YkuD